MKFLLALIFIASLGKVAYAAEANLLEQIWGETKRLGNTVVEAVGQTVDNLKKDNPEAKPNNPGSGEQIFQEVWKDFSEVANEAVDLATKSDNDSRTAIEFLTAQEPKYIRLLKKAQDILSNSETREHFDDIHELQLANRKLSEESVELKRKKISAPSESMNPLVKTRKDIDARLTDIPKLIAENNEQIDTLQDEILSILHRSGINISHDELKYFIISAEGSEIIKMMNIADNMKKMQVVIERELTSDPNNIELAKIYTGMYLVSLEAYSYAHNIAQENIANYKARIRAIIDEAELNYNEAKRLRKTASEADIRNLDSNLAINERTIYVANMYEGLLERRIEHLKKSKAATDKKVLLAKNTYKTMVNGSSLISLVNSGSQEYALLVNFEMPELKTIYDSAMLNAFTEISERIKREE